MYKSSVLILLLLLLLLLLPAIMGVPDVLAVSAQAEAQMQCPACCGLATRDSSGRSVPV